MTQFTDQEIHDFTEVTNLPGYKKGRLSPDQVQIATRLMLDTRESVLKWKSVSPDDAQESRDAADMDRRHLIYQIALFIPESEQAPEGTYPTGEYEGKDPTIPPNNEG